LVRAFLPKALWSLERCHDGEVIREILGGQTEFEAGFEVLRMHEVVESFLAG
jgi:hypothetical protein